MGLLHSFPLGEEGLKTGRQTGQDRSRQDRKRTGTGNWKERAHWKLENRQERSITGNRELVLEAGMDEDMHRETCVER